MRSASVWSLAGERALLECGPLHACVDLDDTGTKLVVSQWQDSAVDDLGIFLFGTGNAESPNLELVESYVRGADLVARYAPIPPSNISPQVYWRATSDATRQVAKVEFILSMHTNLLDSRPNALVMSVARNVQIFHVSDLALDNVATVVFPFAIDTTTGSSADSLLLFRFAGGRFSYAQMAHPGDFVSTKLVHHDTKHGWHTFETHLLAERLEKGVIRRARICGWFMPAENDLALAVELARQFIDEPLPLTA